MGGVPLDVVVTVVRFVVVEVLVVGVTAGVYETETIFCEEII